MTLLHVACMPFPTHQGTQAAVSAMLDASSERRRRVRLLTYWARGYDKATDYRVDRIPDFPSVPSLRSGPSIGKLTLDARCILEIRRLARVDPPSAIVAHHIEAAAAAIAARVAPVFYLAHTRLATELPVYLPKVPAPWVSAAGHALEDWVCRHAAGVAAVAPMLADALGAPAMYVPVPWKEVEPATAIESDPVGRQEARAMLRLPERAPVSVYAGNLDRYQGWETLVDALRRLRTHCGEARLLVATESEPGPARDYAERRGVGHALTLTSLGGERQRQLVHAAADFAWVPRRTPGGLPIKLLDAFGRSLPVITTRRATAGLPVEGACRIVADDDPNAFANASAELLTDSRLAERLAAEARAYLREHHSVDAFDGAMQRWLGGGVSAAERLDERNEPRRSSAQARQAR